MYIRTALALVLLLAFGATACDRGPTEAPLTPGSADVAHIAGFGSDDFDFELIRLPDWLGAHTAVERANTRGDLVGRYLVSDPDYGNVWHGFLLRKDGDLELLHVEGAVQTHAKGINARGTVVGLYMNPDGGVHGFIYEKGEFQTIDVALEDGTLSPDTRLIAINERGVMTGSYADAGGTFRGMMLDRDRLVDVMVPGSDMTQGFDLNIHGQVTGHFTRAGDYRPGTMAQRMYGFIYDDGEYTILDYPGEDDWMSCAQGIGSRGEAVGHVAGVFPTTRAYVWQDGDFRGFFDAPGAAATFPTAIAPNGTVAGYAVIGGVNVGFVARPR